MMTEVVRYVRVRIVSEKTKVASIKPARAIPAKPHGPAGTVIADFILGV